MTLDRKDRVQDTTATTGTGAFTLDGAAIDGYRTFASAHAVGATFEYFVGLGVNWEVGVGTLTDATHVSRAPSASSNGGALVNFPAGSKTIFETVSAAAVAQFLSAADGVTAGGLQAAAALAGTNLMLVSQDGGATLTRVSLALLQAFVTGSASSAADTAAPTAPTNLASNSVTSASFNVTFTPGTDNVAVARTDYSLDGTTWTSAGASSTAAISFTGKSASTTYNVRLRTVDTSGNVSPTVSITVVTAAASGAADTAAPTMSGSVTTSNVTATVATMAYPAGADNVGVAKYQCSMDTGTASWVDNGTALSYTPSAALAASTTYTARVRCLDAAGNISNVLTTTFTTSAAAAAPVYKVRTTDASGNKINGVSYFPTASSSASTMAAAGNGSYYTRDTNTSVTVVKADGTYSPDPVRFVWSDSSTQCPVTHNDASAVAADASGLVSLIYGNTYNCGQIYVRGQPGTKFLWALTSDGFVGCYDNATGTPIGWAVHT